MKKTTLIIILVIALTVSFVVCGCAKVKTDQLSDLEIANIFQDSTGAVHIEIENADKYVLQNTIIEVSCDGGSNWMEYSPNSSVGRLNSGKALYYIIESNNFTCGYNVGDSILVTARLKETTTKNPSNNCASMSYTLKEPYSTNNLRVDTGYSGGSSGTIASYTWITDYDYVSNIDYTDKIIQFGAINIDGDNFSITPLDNYSIFEYHFYKSDLILDNSEPFEFLNQINNYNISNIEWQTMAEDGISFEEDDFVTDNNQNRIIYIYLRVKETSTTCPSEAKIITFNY